MRIEANVITYWMCDFCGYRQGEKRLRSKAPAFEFLIGPHAEKERILICDRCVAMCNEEIVQLKAHQWLRNQARQPSELAHTPQFLDFDYQEA